MSAIYVNLDLKVLNTIVLRRVRFRCSGVFHWYYVGVPLVFQGVLLVLQGILLFRYYSEVFRCSAGVPCSGVPGFIVCQLLRFNHCHTQGFSYLWCPCIRIPHKNSALPFRQRKFHIYKQQFIS